jgi:kynureninase
VTDPASDGLVSWRAEFPIVNRVTYLVAHSVGPMPRRARARLERFADEWDAEGVGAFAGSWWDLPVPAGERIARLIGAAPSSIATHANVSTALAVILSTFDWRRSGRRTRIVASALDFSTLLYACAAEQRLGARFALVPGEERDPLRFDLERFLEAIDEETALVVLSAVLFRTAELIPLEPIVARAKESGARVCVDLYQAAGTVPVDVSALGVDFALGGSVKWLCGGLGCAYLYVAPECQRVLEPRFTGWAAHEEPFRFAPPPQRYAAGMARFQAGSPNVPALVAAAAGQEILAEIGVDVVRRKSERQTAELYALCEAQGFRVRSPREAARRGGSITVEVAAGEVICRALAERGVVCDYRPGAGLRFSPHFYTTDAELGTAVAALVEATRDQRLRTR